MIYSILDSALRSLQSLGNREFNAIATICILTIFWLSWRIWKFTITPLIWPNEPVVFPYTVPFLGHTLSFLVNPEGTIQRANRHFKGDTPYALSIGGRPFLIVRNPNDVLAVWRDTKSLSFDHYMQNTFAGIGVRESSYSLMFRERPATFYKTNHDVGKEAPFFVKENPLDKRFIDIQDEWIKEQFQSSERAKATEKLLLEYMDSSLAWEKLSTSRYLISEDLDCRAGGTKVLSLYSFCRYTLVDAACMTFLGPEILNVDPEFVEHYVQWDNTSWKIPHQVPRFLCRDLNKARDKLVNAFVKYYSQPEEERPHLSWLFSRMQSEQQHLGFSLHEAASISILMLWAVNFNTFRMAFWVFAHIICDPQLKPSIISELAPLRRPDGSLDLTDLPSSCPTLDAVWLEALRLYNNGTVARNTIRTTVIGNKTVRPGTQVLGPLRTTHLQPSIFGPDAADFNVGRWMKDKNLESTKGFAPFGGGKTLCPGRFLAKREVTRFVAIALSRFDFKPAGETKVPLPAVEKPALTMLDPRTDLLVEVTQRKD
ncbi:hypothetical protein BC1G_07665 [Paecilomyces variotii No. 5]|uniref:Cytochrome P450 n=1 Tax=Byssochlamys spectabilis (strain No. 5 / NBRC 109023) TaxID=1356009 RepID=V5FEZ2_BYSSN|nr:hypothetical protein BC1G_07665 [Paecilomyces variotii No. 5]